MWLRFSGVAKCLWSLYKTETKKSETIFAIQGDRPPQKFSGRCTNGNSLDRVNAVWQQKCGINGFSRTFPVSVFYESVFMRLFIWLFPSAPPPQLHRGASGTLEVHTIIEAERKNCMS